MGHLMIETDDHRILLIDAIVERHRRDTMISLPLNVDLSLMTSHRWMNLLMGHRIHLQNTLVDHHRITATLIPNVLVNTPITAHN